MTVKASCHQVDCDKATGDGGAWDSTGTGLKLVSYPTLHELDATEIPTKPTAPTIADGTTEVGDATELQDMAGAGSYILTADIDLTGVAWTPITNFTGTLDGDGHTISNLTIAGSLNNQGLIGTAGYGAKVKDLTIDGFNILGTRYISGIIAQGVSSDITINNITVTNSTIVSTSGDCGAIIGNATSAANGNTVVHNCIVSGSEIGQNDAYLNASNPMGGIAGRINDALNTSGGTEVVDCSITESTVRGANSTGGLIGGISGGASSGSYIHTCYADVTIEYTYDGKTIGGFLGSSDDITIVNSYSQGDFSGNTDNLNRPNYFAVGGFIGILSGDTNIIDCYSSCNIVLIPERSSMTAIAVGGFIGKMDSSDSFVTRCYFDGTINITSIGQLVDGIGGFVGYLLGDDPNSYIKRSWSEGDITIDNGAQSQYIGGFVGALGSSVNDNVAFIENCYSWSSVIITNGNLSSGRSLGGFIGGVYLADTTNRVVTNCYCAQTDVRTGSGYTDQLTYASAKSGGFAGNPNDLESGTVTYTNCFFDQETCGFTDDYTTATNHTTVLMMTKTTYTDAGWVFSTADGVKDDINSIWTIANTSTTGTSDQDRTVAYPEDYAHIEGQTVQVLEDGIYIGDYVVTGGAVTI